MKRVRLGDPNGRMEYSAKRKAVAQGVFRAEMNEFLSSILAEDGYAGVDIRQTPVRTEIIIKATNQKNVLGERGLRIRELTAMIQKRFGLASDAVDLFVDRVADKGLCSMSMAESLRHKLLNAIPARRAAYSILRTVMDAGAVGCEVIVSGKVRAQRAKAMKFTDGYLLTTGHPSQIYVDSAVRSVQMRQGVLGVKVKIMKPHDVDGIRGPKIPIPDKVLVHEPKV